MDSNYDDSDDSSIFLKSIGQKRKASGNVNSKHFKQAKLNLGKSKNAETDKMETDNTEPDMLRGNSMSDDNAMGFVQNDETANDESSLSVVRDPDVNEAIKKYYSHEKCLKVCLLCSEPFKTDMGFVDHVKKCIIRRKMTKEEFLVATRIQTILDENRIVGGRRRSAAKEREREILQADYELALGIALSKSLNPEQSQNSTLEEYGFTYNGSGPSKRKAKGLKTCILRDRTPSDRVKIITEKAAVVLLNDDDDFNLKKMDQNPNMFCQSDFLARFQCSELRLWNMGEDEDNSDWYVNNMLELLRTDEEKGEDKEKEEEATEAKAEAEEEDEDEEEEEEEEEEEKEDSPLMITVTQESFMRELYRLKLPMERIYVDWNKMINNDKLSDMFGKTKDSETVYMHSIVLYARCPDMLGKDISVFTNYSLSTILIFLEYLYCGTLNGLTPIEFDNVSKLAFDLDYRELLNVLKCLENNLSQVESSRGVIPSSVTPGGEFKPEYNQSAQMNYRRTEREDEVTIMAEAEKDIFGEEMIDLTGSNHASPAPAPEPEDEEVESNADKSYWSFLQERRRERLKAELRMKEEEREKSIINAEMEKIKTSMEQQNEMMQRIYDEFEEEESDFKGVMEADGDEEEEREGSTGKCKSRSRSRSRSNDSATNDMFEEVKSKEDVPIDCIVLSSDSETRASNGEVRNSDTVPVDFGSKPETNLDFESPYFDPYENVVGMNDFSNCNFSPVILHSQSLVSEIAPFTSPSKRTPQYRNPEEGSGNSPKGPEYFSTPVARSQSSSRADSSPESQSREERMKRKSALGAGLTVRKSLGLNEKKSKSSSSETAKIKSCSKGKDLAKVLTDSVLHDLSSSLMTPVQNKFVEMTPRTTRDIEYGESVTPSPNFTLMGESMLKEHLSKYGLKKSLAKTKARKILRHIYEELHPILNTETGALVKIVPSENTKRLKKGKSKKPKKKSSTTKSKEASDSETATREQEEDKSDSSPKEPDAMSEGSVDSFERSTDYDSEGSEFEDIQEPLTQSAANNPVDLPSAFSEFLTRNPEYHQKILLYEPIWLEELQRQLKETFQKHFKLSDLMDYLDQKCITFRSEAQKKGNEKKNRKIKKSKKSKKSKETN